MPNRLLSKLLELLFPMRCVSCRASGKLLCGDCRNRLQPLDKEFCIVCDKPAVGGFTHPGCATKFTPERTIAGFWYKGPVPRLIIALKFKRLYPLARVLAELLIENLQERGISFEGNALLLLPIPLSFWRKGARGFNQSELLARALGEKLDLPVEVSVLRKVRDIEPLAQKGVGREERLKRIRGAFAVPEDKEEIIRGKDILLVDDVLTSGATAREATKVLKKSGVGQVWVLTFAKSRLWRD